MELVQKENVKFVEMQFSDILGTVKSVSIPADSLDEALAIIQFGVPEKNGPNRILVKRLRSDIQGYLQTLYSAFIRPADHPPPHTKPGEASIVWGPDPVGR